MPTTHIAERPRQERLFVLIYSVLLCLSVAHFIYYGYAVYYNEITGDHHGLTQQQFYDQRNTTAISLDHPFFSGRDHAPGQYRIGIELPAAALARAVHLTRLYQLFAALDCFTGIATCLLLYNTLCRSGFFQQLAPAAQTLCVALLLAAFAYPLFWTINWIRPETFPSSLYLALALNLIVRLGQQPKWLAVLLPATLWQALARSDVAAIFGLAVLIFAFTPSAVALFRSRRLAIFTGAAILSFAVATQAWLQFVLYPHATYSPEGKPFVLFYNLQPRILVTFFIALLPCAFCFALAVRLRRHLGPSDLLALLAACLYLPLWITVGILIEIRIFVPFLTLLTPTVAKLLTLQLATHEPAPLGPHAV